MREYVSKLLARNEMRVIERPVDPRFELAAVVARSQKDSDLPLLFRDVKGSQFPVLSNLYGSNKRLKEIVGAGSGSFAQHWGKTIDAAM